MFAYTACINGETLWDNAYTIASVSKYNCSPSQCDVQLSGCSCSTPIDPNTVDITTAPWYCADDVTSEDFLGVYMIRADGHDTRPWSREIYDNANCPDGQCGGGLSSLRTGMRTMTFTVMGIGRTCAGAAYGKRWLLDRLQGGCSSASSACTFTMQLSDCCTLNETTGEPRVWSAHKAGVVGAIDSFENVCSCLVWRATFQIAMQPYFYDCDTTTVCSVSPPACTATTCVPFDDWAARYDDMCNADCSAGVSVFPFAQSCDEVFANQILGECGDSGRATPCGDLSNNCFAASDPCSFTPPKPVSSASKCDPCISANMSDWGSCCTIDAVLDDYVFDVKINAGDMDVFGIHVAIFDECPTNDTNCVNPIWDLTIPQMNAGSTFIVDGIECVDTFNCNGKLQRGARIGAVSRGATILNCGTYYAAVRYACLDDDLVQSTGFSVQISPIARRASV